METSDTKPIVILGGGPAGSAAAIHCRQIGLPVVLLEKEKQLTPRPGEILHPGIEILLTQLDVYDDFSAANFSRHEGNYIKWNDTKRFELFGKSDYENWKGFQVQRPDFDNILLNKAKKLGTQVRFCKALSPIIKNNKITGVKTSEDVISSSFLIDATGSQHWIAKNLDIPMHVYSPALYTYYGYAKGSCNNCDQNPLIRSVDDGWIWIAQINSNLYQWVRLHFTNKFLHKHWLPEEFVGLKQVRLTRRKDVTWKIISKPADLNYYVVGDSCSILDPASSHGVLRAIMSGMMASHMIKQSINDPSLEKLALREYSKWIKNWFLHDVKRLRELYAQHPHPPKWLINTN